MTARKSIGAGTNLPEEVVDLLREHPVFSQLRQASWTRLIETGTVREYETGLFLCHEEEAATAAWMVLKGETKLIRHTSKGQLLLVDIMLPGEIFGAVFYTDTPVHPVSAVTLKRTRLLAFPLAVLVDELPANPALQAALLEDTCLKLCQSIALRGLALEELPVRLASILCLLHEKFGSAIPETRATLAELAGTTTESAIRVTRQMQAAKILRLKRGQIEILSPDRLRQLAAITIRHRHSRLGRTDARNQIP